MKLLLSAINLKTKLTLLVVAAVMIIVTVLGIYFDRFIRQSYIANTQARMLHGYARLLSNIDGIEKSLGEGVGFIGDDEAMIASIELVNHYQDKNDYNTFLIDEEKKAIGESLLSQVKISSNDSVMLYDRNMELIAFVIREASDYHIGFVSYKSGRNAVYIKHEYQQEFSAVSLVHAPALSLSYPVSSDNRAGAGLAPIHYQRHGDAIEMTSGRLIYDKGEAQAIGYVAMSRILDHGYFRQLSDVLGIELQYSFDNPRAEPAPLLREAIASHRLQLNQHGDYFRAVVRQPGLGGSIFYAANLDKTVLDLLLSESRRQLVIILVMVAISTLLLMRYVIKQVIDTPLSQLMRQIRRIDAHDYTVSGVVSTGDELETISENINQLAATVQEREASLERSMAELEYLSNHDVLTGLPNRRIFSQRLKHALELSERSSDRLCVIFLDLDQFKMVNDTLGHDVGDELLLQVGGRLKTSMRRSDTLARIGGDEFNILIENLRDTLEVERLVRKYLALFKEPFSCFGHNLSITVSIGVAFYPDDGMDAITLTKHADLAMYSAKEHGRNSFAFFSHELSVSANEQVSLIQALEAAIEAGDQFEVYYQAKVGVNTHKVHSIEALLRWFHPTRGMVPQGSFIRLAEETGLIIPIGKWVLEQACRDFIKLQTMGIELEHVSVNVSNVQMNNTDMVAQVERVIKRTGIRKEQLELEITESYIATNIARAIETLRQFSQMGIGLAIDDFGTGYSSMSYLQKLPVSRLKIDKSFVDGLPGSKDSRTIIRAIIGLAKSFGLSITAEGVETQEQLQFLEQELCDEIQGYYFAKPLPLEAFIEKYRALNHPGSENVVQLSHYKSDD